MTPVLNRVRTSVLEIAYEQSGPEDGVPVLLMHGFPYDPRTYDRMIPLLVAGGCRAIVPYLRGYGPTRFLAAETPRSGQQAALGNDLKELIDALGGPRVVLAGYDWGGRAACVVAALWPDKVRGLVSANGYNIQDIAGSTKPVPPEQEHRLWYQYYFHTERGRAGLQANRREFCKLLWRLWSPNWRFDDATYDRTAAYVAGDPSLEPIEQRLAAKPRIPAPTIVLHGDGSGLSSPASSIKHAPLFTGPYQHRVIPVAGHNLPQETPNAVADAVLELVQATA
jgi:pimeloyl-ACP methyl ester carboxylesterase